jgi:3-keto-L-gulonate-6-phosphate decarboxylase
MNKASDHAASARVRETLRNTVTFQMSVDVGRIGLGIEVAEAALKGGVDIIEMGTPLLKTEGVRNVVPAFRARFPGALLLADMKSMDGAGYEAEGVYTGGANIIDFLALAGVASARAVCAARDGWRARDGETARLAFADILLPQEAPLQRAVETARAMVEAGVDGVGLHLQLDARRADAQLFNSGLLTEAAQAVFETVGDVVSVQVVGGLTLAQATDLRRRGLKAFVISGNLGFDDGVARYERPAPEIEAGVREFIAAVRAA